MDEKLRRLQKTQLEILKVIDKICEENKIEYSLYAGTLIGAVRHEGFIPWDDDLDVCMSRTDYERFIKVWNKKHPDGYFLQNKENTPGFTQSFSKIRKKHTTFLQYDFERDAYHTGIFVDIFPLDRIPDNRLKQILFKWDCVQYQLLTREFLPSKSGTLVKGVSKVVLTLYQGRRRKKKRIKLYKTITKYKKNRNLKIVAIDTIDQLNTLYPADMLDEFVKLKFEDGYFKCLKKYKQNLSIMYGDYMKLPPKEERNWKHHPIILNFEKDYEEIQNEQ